MSDSASGLPGDSASGLPGDAASGLPGEAASGLPGATFACAPAQATGEARCTLAININVAPQANPQTPSANIAGLQPADLQSAYALPASRPGATVAVVDAYDAPSAESDLAVYRAAFGLPACTSLSGCLRKVNQRGQTTGLPAPNTAWAQEIALDLEMVSAACPNCSILLVEADSALIDDLGASVDTAAALGAAAISNSYYASEWANERAEDAHYTHPGVALTVSSGDIGKTSYPAASQLVTAVGGTSLRGSAGAWSETFWKYGGRGCSYYISKPDWQRDSPCKSTRSVVDVAAVADPQTGVAMFNGQAGGWLVAGGTSVGAPLVAAAYALSTPQGPAYSYAHRGMFHDVPPAGFDLATGLGSPNGVGGL